MTARFEVVRPLAQLAGTPLVSRPAAAPRRRSGRGATGPVSPSVTACLALLGAVLIGLPLAGVQAQGSADEGNLRELAGRAPGYTGEVRALLARGVSPNVPDSRGRTAVHAAARIGAAVDRARGRS